MKKTGTTKDDFEMIEINEAFSVVVLANIKVVIDYFFPSMDWVFIIKAP